MNNTDGAVISPRSLQSLRESDPESVVLDVRWQVGMPALRADYLSAHIPGALFCDLDADLAAPAGAGGRHPLPDPGQLQRRLAAWGVGPDTTVLAYDGGSGVAASRAWFVLRWAGIEDVRVLDGGFAAWTAADLPVDSGDVAEPGGGTARVRAGAMPVLTAEQARDLAERGRLLDVRTPERFRGENEPMDPVAGHIPGARNIADPELARTDGGFLPAAAVRRRLELAGLPALEVTAPTASADPIGVYCGSGVTASHTLLTLTVAGVPAMLYPGSWSEWITDTRRPVAVGEQG